MTTRPADIACMLPIGFAGLILASAVSLAATPTTSTSSETPDEFVRRVYAQYRTFDSPGVSTDRPNGTPYYTAALLDAFAKESASVNGEVGAIDSDPLCNCQAYEKLRVKTVAITKGSDGSVVAHVYFMNFGAPETATLTLMQTPEGWRIGDVGNKNMKSVMAVLQDAIAHPIQETPPGKADGPAPKP